MPHVGEVVGQHRDSLADQPQFPSLEVSDGEPGHLVDRIERLVRWFDGYSDHHDVPRATERGDEGLSTAEEEEE